MTDDKKLAEDLRTLQERCSNIAASDIKGLHLAAGRIEALSFQAAAMLPIVESVARQDPVFVKGRHAKKLIADARIAMLAIAALGEGKRNA